MEVEGRSAFKLKEKLKGLKYKLKEWCNVNVGRLEDKINIDGSFLPNSRTGACGGIIQDSMGRC